MRRLAMATALAGSLIALSCTDQRQEGPTEPSSAKAASSPCPSPDPIQSQICALFPPNDLLKSASDFYNNIKTKKQQNRIADAQARAFVLVDFTLDQLAAGKLLDPNGSSAPTREEAVATLTCDVLEYVDLSCGGLSDEALGDNGTAQVVGPAGGLVLTPDKHSGVSIPPGAMPSAGLITITPIPATGFPPRGGPLPTALDQYPLFREYTLSASFTQFNEDVLVGICQLDVGDGPYAPPDLVVYGRLQLAHLHPNNPATIELLARANAPFLDCSDFTSDDPEIPPPDVIGLGFLNRSNLAVASRAVLRHAVVPVLATLLPEPAEAAVLGSCCLGGSTRKFTPWAAVDPQSGTATSTSLTSDASLAIVGAPLTLTATVTPAPFTAEGPVVQFFDGAASLGTATANSDGVATLTTSSLSLAQHSLTAKFLGTTSYITSTSSALTQNMVQRFTTLTAFNSALGEASTLTENFNTFDEGTPISTIIDGVLNVTSSFDFLEVFGDNVLFGFDDHTRAAGEGRYDLTFVTPLTKNALAFDVTSKDPATDPAQALVNTATGSASFSVQNTSGSETTPVFLGFIASAPFASAALIEGPETDGEGNEEVSLDNFVVAEVSLSPSGD